jgi:hypothetical protein
MIVLLFGQGISPVRLFGAAEKRNTKSTNPG